MNEMAENNMANRDKDEMTSRDLQAAERRQQLLESAKELFFENGYSATPTRMINQKIGMADGLMYHYFPKGKLQILHTIATEGIEEIISSVNNIAQSLDVNGDVREELTKFFKEIYLSFNNSIQCIGILVREQRHLEENHVMFLKKSFEERYALISNYLEQCHSKGKLKDMNFDIASKQLLSIAFFFFMKNIAHIDFIGADSDSFIEDMVDFNIRLWIK